MTTARDQFEAWASQPPREWSLTRQAAEAAWPGQYNEYHVQCAWEVWQEFSALRIQAQAGEDLPKGEEGTP